MKLFPFNRCSILALALIVARAQAADAPPAPGFTTPWTERGAPSAPAYPRPLLVREPWTSLDGPWEYAIRARERSLPPLSYDGTIRVPFAAQSLLSGVQRTVGPDQRLWYRKRFEVKEPAAGEHLILHFGAVDWQADVFVNGRLVGRHEGGFDAFSFDVTPWLKPDQPQEVVVAAWNPVDRGSQPRGKQVLEPGNIFYTAVTGIWQTVWLETVPRASVQGVAIVPDFDRGNVSFRLKVTGGQGAEAQIRILDHGREVARATVISFDSAIDYGSAVELAVPDFHAWSPDDPFLYDVDILYRSRDAVDRVRSYFGFRKVEVRQAEDGHERIFLNHRPLFLFGPLDQGWWPDGLYTAPTDEALRWDIETMKRMGFNLVRKHVKVEPDRWYYYCDQLGLLVWQDMPSGMQTGNPAHVPPRQQPVDGIFTPQDDAQFRRELASLVENHTGFLSIIAWVPFNECWGQHATNEILAGVKRLDPARLVDGPSGWNDLGFGDMIDRHDYPGPSLPPPRAGRASVLGEFGGLGLPVSGHLWQQEKNWGYREFGNAAEMTAQYETLLAKLRPLIAQGLAAAVYTQFTDVETEVNGLVTYDRKVSKIPLEKLAELHRTLLAPEPK